MNFKALAQKYKTPLYVYDFDHIKSRYNELKDAFHARKSLICYAVKANSNLSVLKLLAELGAGFDCVSIGEVRRAIMAGAKKYQIIFSGVGKSDDELKEALENEILMINLESEAEMYRLESIAKELNLKARISIRINPDVDAKTHPYISTGLNENKFGVDITTGKKMYIYAKNSPHIEPIGVHFHIGSQLTNIEPIIEAAGIVSELVRELKALDIDIKFFDVGGGVGIVYQNENNVSLYDYAQGILGQLSAQDLTIVCEPGRFIVGNAGYFVTSVLYEKFNKQKRFIVVDGAMNDLIRPSLYGAYHDVNVVDKNTSAGLCDVVGPICESGDFLAKNLNLPACESGDLLVVKSAGAYGFTMSSNYNSRARAAEVAVQDGEDRLIRRRESFEDIVALEKDLM
ncbi:diaminopimelate decarboxylase [Campylobacter californiensis]|uniref:diaminopimelate decarboxylase n=1 Tax=Campylobacter californiensis TaxID=1032243 RepID=UPI0014757E06|nr:diaminopimelate decarboxylase [Campylobacter sp. RM12916]MBE3609617.1 diaminopimelate decarboxylase [Campylobacter sp. RM12916]